MFFVGSAHFVNVKGKRASPKDAPILLGAPHTSFFDALSVLLSGPAGVVAKLEAGDIPFYGSK
jgi:lysophosphatidylcholine acyltransferase/lyso-PAF acetyltransferase